MAHAVHSRNMQCNKTARLYATRTRLLARPGSWAVRVRMRSWNIHSAAHFSRALNHISQAFTVEECALSGVPCTLFISGAYEPPEGRRRSVQLTYIRVVTSKHKPRRSAIQKKNFQIRKFFVSRPEAARRF